ncbi:putative ABC transporter, permease component [Candidatus Nitrospira nitrosa]|uniref:Putative ABC transporter, permease component n=2 Tax=Candidatus Nitrospira nitrosa TaxID=1742972 RepID=A0A0S4LPI6_9BACT|nr:putative ABC transporter, permease component [Candidatus Nitrospira nitrosa]
MLSFIKVVLLILLSHLRQWPLRTALTIGGVALGVSASVAVRTANVDVLSSFEQAVLTVAGPTTLEVAGGEAGLDERLITHLRTVPGVTTVSPVILQTAVRIRRDQPEQAIQVLGLDLLAEFNTRGFRVSQPTTERQMLDMIHPYSVFMGEKLATEWNLSVGDEVHLLIGTGSCRCRVAGILHGESDQRSSWERLAVMDIAAAQVTFGMVGLVDRIDLVTAPNLSVEEVAEKVRTVLPPHVTVERPVNRTSQVEQMISAFRLNLTVLSWVGLLVGMFLIYNTMAFAVAQRRREIGIYRAVGMTQGRVALLFLIEAGLFGILGGVLGSIAGMVLAQQLIALLSRTISDLYVPVSAGGSESLWAGPWFTMGVEGVLIGCVVSMIGAIGPSVDASRTATVRALAPGDYEASQQLRVGRLALMGCALLGLAGFLSWPGPIQGVPVLGYMATLCLLAGLACLAPLCVTRGTHHHRSIGPITGLPGVMRTIAVEHASRNPGRNGVTVSAFMVGLAIMIGVLVMVRSFRHTVEVWVADTVLADVVVAPSLWLRGTEIGTIGRSLPPAWTTILSSIPEVAAVDTYRDVRITLQGHRVAVVSRDLRLHAQWSQYLVRNGDSSEQLNRAAEIGGLLVSEVLADRLGVREGSSLDIMTPSGVRQFPIVAVFYDYSTDGGKLLMDRALYQSLWHDEFVTVFPVYLRERASLDRVRARIGEQLSVVTKGGLPPLVISNTELRKEILEIFDRTFLLTYVLEAIAVVIAMLGIVNTLITSVLERRREFATLRAIGGSPGQIQQLVLWEAIYLGAIGIVLGLIGGGLLSLLLIKVINKQSFGWTIQMIIPIGSLLQAVALAVLATLVAGYFPARWAARQPVVEGLRDE